MGLNHDSGESANDGASAAAGAINIVQRGNLKTLEKILRKQWRLGQNIVLCWSADERGLLVIFVPHYFLGNYCAAPGDDYSAEDGNEAFIRDLISGSRRKTRDELFAVSERLDVSPTFIKLNTALSEEGAVVAAVEQLIKRYGLSYVESRGVLLFDIVNFSLHTPFEQASQLNSLSYSLNSAYNKLLAQGMEVNFSRTTTGDGYYVWNRDTSAAANQELFYFMLLVVADNAMARAASRGNTVPVIRTAYHIGGHYELYQAEGVNPTVFSYIVGDVTIELARMVDLAQANQVLIGDFSCERPLRARAEADSDSQDSGGGLGPNVNAPAFISICNRDVAAVTGTYLAGKPIRSLSCRLSENTDNDGRSGPRRFRIVDKHGLSRHAYNLQIEVNLDGRTVSLGLPGDQLPCRVEGEAAPVVAVEGATEIAAEVTEEVAREAPSADELIDDLAGMLKRRSAKIIAED